MKTLRKRELKKLLRRPLSNPAELEQLGNYVAERQTSLRDRGRVALAIAAIIAVIAVLAIVSGPSADHFILPAMLILAITIAMPSIVRRGWAEPRLLAVQRRLLYDRDLSNNELEEPEVILADLEARIDKAEALLRRDHAAPARSTDL